MSRKEKSPSSRFLDTKRYCIYTLIAACIIFFFLKLPFISHAPAWDESVYLEMGKYIYSSGSSGLWEMIRPLGLPVITGFFWKLGLDQIIASRIFSIIISIGCIIVTYLIAKKLFDEKHAIISALLLALTPVFFFYSDFVLTDHVSTLLIMLTLFFLIRERYVLGGVFAGLAFWFKFTNILFVLALSAFIIYKVATDIFKNKKKIGDKKIESIYKYISCIAIIMVFIAAYFLSNYLLYNAHFSSIDAILRPYLDASAYSNNPYQNLTFTNLSGFIYYIGYYLYQIIFSTTYGFFAYIFFVIYMLEYRRIANDGMRAEWHQVILTVFLIYLLYFSIIPYKNERFAVNMLPLMAIYASYGLIRTLEYFSSKKRSTSRSIYQVIIGVLMATFVILSINGIAQFYKWNDVKSEPNYSIERYFDSRNITGPILTNYPQLTVYSDERYVAAYDILNKNGLFVNDWEKDMKFSGAIQVKGIITCLDTDTRCAIHEQKMEEIIRPDFVVSDSFIYQGNNVTFYIKKS